MLCDGVIFDLDGTLWDSCRSVAASWVETLAKNHGGLYTPTVEDVRGIMGMTAEQIAEKLFSVYGREALSVCRDCIDHECAYIAVHGGKLYPGVEELFQALEGVCGLYIVSNCQRGYIECFLDYTGLGKYIRDYECSGSTGLSRRKISAWWPGETACCTQSMWVIPIWTRPAPPERACPLSTRPMALAARKSQTG